MPETKTTVYVVMGNDYPDSVFSDAAGAENYIEQKKSQPNYRLPGGGPPRIYWRVYDFVLDDKVAS